MAISGTVYSEAVCGRQASICRVAKMTSESTA